MDTPQTPEEHLAAFDRRTAELADWRRVEPRTKPVVRTLTAYRALTGVGQADALLYLREQGNPLNPTPAVIAQTHRHIYCMAIIDAGEFRKAGQQHQGAEPQRIQVELKRLEGEMDELLASATTQEAKIAAVAFYHARFMAIHPFVDGNGRVGRTLLMAQFKHLKLPLEVEAISKPKYDVAMAAAMERDDIGPMTHLLGRACGIDIEPAVRPAIAKVACRPMMDLGDVLPLEQEREIARSMRPLPVPRTRSLRPDALVR